MTSSTTFKTYELLSGILIRKKNQDNPPKPLDIHTFHISQVRFVVYCTEYYNFDSAGKEMSINMAFLKDRYQEQFPDICRTQ